jgi:hypothetical protein
MISQERMDLVISHQMAAQRSSVQQLTVRLASTLHPAILFDPRPEREHQQQDSSTVS